ncbi:midnolin homolog [Drosophila willistoni]|uniref:midnolin homolog n=1 Tax=Drosophila willistoni TaxID=7260 RepID=UPI001F081604|nr:midnolin homolog [Drosophila willistoni]
METKTPPPVNASYHHQRAPRTPESYFNVPESVALLNIVKSERIQSAFQSNRKNHASVWEMVAEVLNRFSARKRTAKQCCNRYENLKKIYTQLKKNPERHVRRNWPYMFLFKEIEEQRGECWGSNGKRLALISKNHNELSYYQRRRQAAELGVLLNKDNLTPHQHSLLQSLSAQSHAHSTDSSQSGASKLERFLPNHFVETQLGGGGGVADTNGNGLAVGLPAGVYDDSPLQLQVAGAVAAAAAAVVAQKRAHELQLNNGGGSACGPGGGVGGGGGSGGVGGIGGGSNSGMGGCGIPVPDDEDEEEGHRAAFKDHHGHGHGLGHGIDEPPEAPDYEKDCNGALNLHHHHHHHHHHQNSSNNDNNISMKSEPLSEGEFNPDDIQLMQTNYNGTQNFYSSSIDQNILHPDVIVDTDNLSDCSSNASMKSAVAGGGAKRKLSTSTDGDSTNYELIEYLKRREKRDEELLKRMDAREERFMNLLERTVIAIETLAAGRSEPTSTSVSAAATKIAPITAPGTTTTTTTVTPSTAPPQPTTTTAKTSDATSQETNNQTRVSSPPLCLATSTTPPPAEQSNVSPCSPLSPSPVTATSEDVIVLIPDEQEA